MMGDFCAILGLKSLIFISFLHFFFFNKVALPQKSGFLLCFFVFLSLSCTVCFYRLLVRREVCVVLVRWFRFFRLVAMLFGG